MGLIDKLISWASSLPRGRMLQAGKPKLLLKKDIPLSEIFSLKINEKSKKADQ